MLSLDVAPTSAPLHPLCQRAAQAGAALREHNRQLWHLARHEWRFGDNPYSGGGWTLPRPFKASLLWISQMSDAMLADIRLRDVEVLDRWAGLLLTQAGLVWDFGAALCALQTAAEGPARAAAMAALRAEWPESYLRFAVGVATSFEREDLEGWDGNQAQLAVLAGAPPELALPLMPILQRAGDIDRAVEQDPELAELALEMPEAFQAISQHVHHLSTVPMGGSSLPCRGVSMARLDLWHRIARRFSLEQVERPGMDEGKLACLCHCPAAVDQALLPSAAVLGHLALLTICEEARAECDVLIDRVHSKRRRYWRGVAAWAVERSLQQLEQEALRLEEIGPDHARAHRLGTDAPAPTLDAPAAER